MTALLVAVIVVYVVVVLFVLALGVAARRGDQTLCQCGEETMPNRRFDARNGPDLETPPACDICHKPTWFPGPICDECRQRAKETLNERKPDTEGHRP